MIGEKVSAWISAEMPRLVAWVGGMEEWQLIGFTVLIFTLGYALYVAVYNAYLTAVGAYADEDYLDFEPGWMDAELWEDER